jgi:hypothetical protein
MRCLIALALLASTTVHAADKPPATKPAPVPIDPHEPVPSPMDSRIRSWVYQPSVVLRITATGLSPIRLVFDPGESSISMSGRYVERDATKSNYWFATDDSTGNANGGGGTNFVVLQPRKTEIPPSFLFLTTVLNNTPYNWVLELRTRPETTTDPTADPDAYIQVNLSHPPPPKVIDPAAQNRAQRLAIQAIDTRLTQARYNGPRNWDYSKRGATCAQLVPAKRNWISDDGQETTLLFFGHKKPPIITTTDDQGDPEMINPTVISYRIGTLYVLPATYETLRLGRGKLACELHNNHYDDTGTTTGTGTISPDVILRTRRAKPTS